MQCNFCDEHKNGGFHSMDGVVCCEECQRSAIVARPIKSCRGVSNNEWYVVASFTTHDWWLARKNDEATKTTKLSQVDLILGPFRKGSDVYDFCESQMKKLFTMLSSGVVLNRGAMGPAKKVEPE